MPLSDHLVRRLFIHLSRARKACLSVAVNPLLECLEGAFNVVLFLKIVHSTYNRPIGLLFEDAPDKTVIIGYWEEAF